MPCVVCKKDRFSFMRIPLELLPERRERYFRNNYFCNHEFDHVCRLCRFTEGVLGGTLNTLRTGADFGLRAALVAVGVLLAYSFLVRQGAGGQVLEYGPVVFGVLVGGVLGVGFFRWIAYAVSALLLVSAFIVVVSYSDYISFLPDVKAMVQREQIKEYGQAQWVEKDSQGRTVSTTKEWDPIKASEERADRERKERVMRFARWGKANSPFALYLTPKQLDAVQRCIGITLGVYLVLLVVLQAVLPHPEGSVADLEKNRKSRRPPASR